MPDLGATTSPRVGPLGDVAREASSEGSGLTITESGLPPGTTWSVSAGCEGTVAVGGASVVVDPANGELVVAEGLPLLFAANPEATLAVFSWEAGGATFLSSASAGTNPVAEAVDPLNGWIYVANSGSNNLTVVNGTTNTVAVASIPVGTAPDAVAYDGANGEVYVANSGSDSVTALYARNGTAVGSIAVGDAPSAVAVDPDSGLVFVANAGSNNLTVVDGADNRVAIASSPVGGTPEALAFDGSDGDVYVSNWGSDNLTVVDGSSGHSLSESIPVGTDPLGIAVGPGGSELYVADWESLNLTVVDAQTESVEGQIPIPATPSAGPLGVVFDAATGFLYVLGGGDLWVIDAADETQCSVQTYSSSGSSIALTLPNGSYGYTPEPVGNYTVAPVDGSFVVAGAPVSEAVEFRPVPTAPQLTGSTLDLVNGSSSPGNATPFQEASPTAVAYDPTLGRLLVAEPSNSTMLFADPVTGAVTGTLASPPGACARGPTLESGLAVDPGNGWSYSTGCGSNLTLVNASTDELEGTIALPVPAWNDTTECPATDYAQAEAIAPAFALGELFVLVVSCPMYASGPTVVSVDAVDLSNGVATSLVRTTSETISLSGSGLSATPLAYDPGSNELYLANENLSGNDSLVSVYDAGTGALVTTVSDPEGAPSPAGSTPLVYAPGLGAVLMTYLVNVTTVTGSNFTAGDQLWTVAELPTAAGSPEPVYDWTGACAALSRLDLGCGVLEPVAVGESPSTPDDVYIVLEGNQTFGGRSQVQVFQVNVSAGSLNASFAIDGTASGVLLVPSSDVGFVLDTSNARLAPFEVAPLRAESPSSVGLLVYSWGEDPVSGAIYLAVGSSCESGGTGGEAGSGCTPQLLVVNASGTGIARSWSLPGGQPGAAAFDPVNQWIVLYNSCGHESTYVCLEDNATGPEVNASITAYDSSGNLVFQSTNVPAMAAGGVVSTVDTRDGNVVFIGLGVGSPKGGAQPVRLFIVNVTSDQVTASGGFDLERCSSELGAAYDAPADVVIVKASSCAAGEPDLWLFNASSGVRLGDLVSPGGLPGALDAATDGLYVLNGTYLDLVSIATGNVTPVLPGVDSGLLAQDPANGLLYDYVGQGTRAELDEVDPMNDQLLAAEPVAAPSEGPTAFAAVGPASHVLTVSPSSGDAQLVLADYGAVFAVAPPLPRLHPVQFSESGLPAGSPWEATVGSGFVTGNGSTLTVWVVNGTYPFEVGASAGWVPTPASGSLTMSGTLVTVPVEFALALFDVTFTVVPSDCGVLSLAGVRYPSGGSAALAEGAYVVVATGCSGFTLSSLVGTGAVSVSGGVAVVSGAGGITATFVPVPTYPVTFTEVGLPSGKTWSVTLGASSNASDGSALTFREPTGTYAFTVAPPAGSSAEPGSGTVSVGSSAVNQTIHFRSNSSVSPGLLGLPGMTGDYVLGGIAVGAAAVGGYFALRGRTGRSGSGGSGGPRSG